MRWPGPIGRAPPARVAATVALLAVLALGQSGAVDGPGSAHARELLGRTLVTFATARTLNGVISVIQGTELALQPAGMGVTLTVGELLDPINDLVERFSWVLLAAATAIGVQIVLLEAAASAWLQVVIGVLAVALVAVLWWPRLHRPERIRAVGAVLLVLLFVRFCLPLAMLASHHFGQAFLEARRDAALATLETAQTRLEALEREQAPSSPDDDASLLERLRRYLDEQAGRLDLRTRLEGLRTSLDAAVGGVIDLIVVFLVQALLAPIAVLAVLWYLTRRALAALDARK